MVGLFAIALIGLATAWDLWRLLDYKRGLQLPDFLEHFVARMFGLIVVPAVIYLSLFAIHFSILDTTGPGDAFMSPKFQATLRGNRFNKETHYIPLGSNIVLMHYQLNSFLHSHQSNYPLKYEDGRISSQGQQVTGYSHEDVNNNWTLLPADGVLVETTADGKTGPRMLRNRDEVRLFHISTGRFLLTHDVASPLTTTNQEFTCVDPETRVPETIFRIELDGSGNDTAKVSTIDSKVRIIHNITRVALHMQKGKLPEWGFGQFEVNGNKAAKESNNIFVITSIVSTPNNSTAPIARDKTNSAMSFMMKFAELQQVMLDQNSALTSSHPYSSSPISWPFLTRGISFWVKDNERQIYLIGNPLVWWTATGSVMVFGALILLDMLAGRRAMDLLGFKMRRRLQVTGMFFAIGYALHYFPFFIMGRQLFLHHYLPALIFSILLCASVFDFIARYRSPLRNSISFAVFMLLFGVAYIYFSPLVYGFKLIGQDVNNRKWLSSWDFSFAAATD